MSKVSTFVACFFSLFLVSCADQAIQARLEAADSLMWSAPDSAYRIVQAINPDSLLTDEQRAYYGLLLTQAQYRTYVPLTSDSLILRSAFYYEGRDDYKYGLSRYYLGAVYQEKEFYHLAIEQYKRALEYIDAEKYPAVIALLFNNMGTVYRRQYFEQEAIKYYRQAERLHLVLDDSVRLSVLYSDMGRAYQMGGVPDSAIHYYNQSLSIAQQLGDNAQASFAQSNVAWLLEAQGQLIEARQQLQQSIAANRSGNGIPTSKQWLLSGQIALAEGKLDSALYCLAQKPTGGLVEDKLKSEIYCVQGRYREAYGACQAYIQKVSNKWEHRDKIRVDEIVAQYDYQRINEEKEALARNQWIWISVGSLLLLLVVALAILYETRRRHHQMEAKNLNEALYGLRQAIDDDHIQLRALLDKRVEQFAVLAEWSSTHEQNDTALAKKVRTMIKQHPIERHYSTEIINTINQTSHGLMNHLRDAYANFTDFDLLVCALTYMGYTSHQLYFLLSARNVQSVYDKKYKILRKMQERGDLQQVLIRISTTL